MTISPDGSDAERSMLLRRQILISGMIDEECANVTIAKLLFLHQQDERAPISLLINSFGGQLTATLPILDTIEFIDPPVHTYGLSHVNGCALWLLAAGVGGHRSIQSDSRLSIEPTRFDNLKPETADYARALNARLAMLLASRTLLSKIEVSSALVHGRSFTVAEAVHVSLADRVSACD